MQTITRMIRKITLTDSHAWRIIRRKWFAFGLKLIHIGLEIDTHLAMRIRLFPAQCV